jgi:hypothetical protein
MYRRSDPRWNRTIQHISDNLEHANEAAQENIYGFTQRYVNPCLSSLTQCANACTAPCFPSQNDRRRHRGRARGSRAELSFDFYDDWEEDENDGLLGWGNDNLERFLGTSRNYGTTTQPERQRPMSYGQRSRDARFNTARRKSVAQARDGGQDPTIIPSSSYFGFLGRLPFNLGGKGLRYKPSAADLTEHPGAVRRSIEEEQPLIEDSEEDAHHGSEYKNDRRNRSNTHTSGHTTDSFSSRGDIFPSEDELDDAVPLDDEFTISLERRTTGQWNDEGSGRKTRSSSSKRPSGSRMSTRTASSRNTPEPARKSTEDVIMHRSASQEIIEEMPSLDDLQAEEERLRRVEEAEVERKRKGAQQLAVKRGLAPDHHPQYNLSSSPHSISPRNMSPMAAIQNISPLVRSPASENPSLPSETVPFPVFVDTIPDVSSSRGGDDYWSAKQSSQLPPSDNAEIEMMQDEFVPARLPHFGSGPR